MNGERLRGRSALAIVFFVVIVAFMMVPETTQYAIWMLPFPMAALVAMRYKWTAVGMAFMSCVALIVIGLDWTSILFAAAMYCVSRVLGAALGKGSTLYASFVTSTLVFIFLELVYLALAYFSGFDVTAEIQRMLQYVSQNDPSVLGIQGSSTKQLVTALTDYTMYNLPAIICVLAFVLTACNVVLARFLLGPKVPYSPFLRVWRLPQSVIGIYVLAMTCVFLKLFSSDSTMWTMVNSAVTLGSFFIGLQGLAFIWRRILQSRARYLWMIILILLSSVVGYLYVLLGLFDTMRISRSRRP